MTPEAEARGLRLALWATLAVLAGVALLTAIPGAPLRNPVTGKIIGDSPFMDSLILIITLVFFAAGLAYGRGAGTIKSKEEVIATITKSWAGLAGLLFLFLLIAQFISYFNFSNMAEVAAVKLGDVLEHMNIGAVWLLIGFIVVTVIVDLIIPQAIAKWALLAPIFIPLFIRLNVAPQTVLAAYRVGDSPAQRDHAADGVLPADRDLHAALPEGRRYWHGRRDHAAVRRHPERSLDVVLRRVVPDRDTTRPRVARPYGVTRVR